MGQLQFDQINIVVPDAVGATRFLRELGVDVPDPDAGWEDWAAHHVQVPVAASFDADLDSSAFASHWGGLPAEFTGLVVNLRTEDRSGVDASFDRAVALGAEGLRPPYDAFWGSRYAVVRGPGPIVVGLMSRPDPEARTSPPDLADLAG